MDVQKGRSKTVALVPDAPITGAVATIYGLDGEPVNVTLTATPSAVDTAVDGDDANTRQAFTVDATTGIVPGLSVLVTDEQWGTAQGLVSAVDTTGKVVRLVDPLPGIPADNARVQGLDVSVTIPAEATADLAKGLILEVVGTGADPVRIEFNVVRFPFVGPCKPHHVRALIARGYPGELSKDEQLHARVADEVNLQIRARLLSSAQYVSAYWNPDTLGPVRAPMLRLVLAEQFRLRESGSSRDDTLSAERLEVTARLGDVLTSIQPSDGNMDGQVDAEEQRGAIGSVWAR